MDQPMSFDGFTVSYSGEEQVCLSSDERLWVQDFTVESHQVNTICSTFNSLKQKNVFKIIDVMERC